MARHLASCERKSAYPTRMEAKAAIVTHSMLDVLGLVRKPDETKKDEFDTPTAASDNDKDVVPPAAEKTEIEKMEVEEVENKTDDKDELIKPENDSEVDKEDKNKSVETGNDGSELKDSLAAPTEDEDGRVCLELADKNAEEETEDSSLSLEIADKNSEEETVKETSIEEPDQEKNEDTSSPNQEETKQDEDSKTNEVSTNEVLDQIQEIENVIETSEDREQVEEDATTEQIDTSPDREQFEDDVSAENIETNSDREEIEDDASSEKNETSQDKEEAITKEIADEIGTSPIRGSIEEDESAEEIKEDIDTMETEATTNQVEDSIPHTQKDEEDDIPDTQKDEEDEIPNTQKDEEDDIPDTQNDEEDDDPIQDDLKAEDEIINEKHDKSMDDPDNDGVDEIEPEDEEEGVTEQNCVETTLGENISITNHVSAITVPDEFKPREADITTDDMQNFISDIVGDNDEIADASNEADSTTTTNFNCASPNGDVDMPTMESSEVTTNSEESVPMETD